MPEELETLILGENELRLERIKLPNGNTYILGCSFEEAQDIYDVLSGNIEAVNDDVEGLKESEKVAAAALNDLDSRITTLNEEVEAIEGSSEDVTEALSALEDSVSDLETDVNDLKESEIVTSASLNDLNSRIVSLTEENISLRSEIADLKDEIALIKRNYMAYYDVDASKGIGENNIYTTP